MQNDIDEVVENKLQTAKNNIADSYKQYLEDIEGIKTIVPDDKRIQIEALIMEIDALHEHLLKFADEYLPPFISKHANYLMSLDKTIEPANDTTTDLKRTA